MGAFTALAKPDQFRADRLAPRLQFLRQSHEARDALASCAAGVQGSGAFGRGGRDGSSGRSKAVLP